MKYNLQATKYDAPDLSSEQRDKLTEMVENSRTLQKAYEQSLKDFEDWQRKAYFDEGITLGTALPIGGAVSFAIKAYKNAQRAKELKEILDKRKDWGIAYRKGTNNPKLAVDTLIEKQNGFVPNIINKDGKDFDLPWGEHNPNTNEGYGLTHFIQQRNKKIDGEKFAREDFVDALNNGRISENKNHPDRFIIEDKNTEISVADNWYGKPRNWIVTAYPKNKSAKKRFASSVPVQQNLDVKNGFSILNSLADNNIISNSKDVFKGAYQKVLDKLNSIR